MKHLVQLLLWGWMSGGAVWAQSAPYADRLTGDWDGARTRAAQRGISLNLDWTQFTQQLLSGTGSTRGDYAGRFDAYINLSSDALDLWKGGLIRTHAEIAYGDLSPFSGGSLMANAMGPALPLSGREKIELTSLHLVQRLGERTNLIIGKVNTIDLIASDPFFGGAGNDRFFNLAFAAPPNGLLPPVIMGGMVSLATTPVSWTFIVYDPEDRTQDYWPDHLFNTGVNVMASGKWDGQILSRSSSFAITGIYSSKERLDLGDLLLPPEAGSGQTRQAWHASLQLAHLLTEKPGRRGEGLGIYARLGVSDGRLNPIQAFFTGGVGGKGLLTSRPDDKFGVGVFYYNFSDALQGAIGAVRPLQDESGIEVFYDFALTRGVRLTVDLQHIDPASAISSRALVGGVRVKVQF